MSNIESNQVKDSPVRTLKNAVIICKIFGHEFQSKWKWFSEINQYQKSAYCKKCNRWI